MRWESLVLPSLLHASCCRDESECGEQVDFNGAYKVCKIHEDLDPFLVLVRMAEQVLLLSRCSSGL